MIGVLENKRVQHSLSVHESILLFLACNDLGDIERVVFHSAVVVEHIGENQTAQWRGFSFGQSLEMPAAVFFHQTGDEFAVRLSLVKNVGVLLLFGLVDHHDILGHLAVQDSELLATFFWDG